MSANSHSLYLNLTDMSGTVTLDHPIPAQEITFKYASMEFSTAGGVDDVPVILFDVDWLGGNQLASNLPNINALPLFPTGLVGVLSSYHPEIKMTIHKAIPSQFKYRFCYADGTTVDDSDIISIHLLFEYSTSVMGG